MAAADEMKRHFADILWRRRSPGIRMEPFLMKISGTVYGVVSRESGTGTAGQKGRTGAAGISEGKADQNGDRIVYERPACQKASGAHRP